MMLLVILLWLSVSLNIALLFGMVRRKADEDIMSIRMREGIKTD